MIGAQLERAPQIAFGFLELTESAQGRANIVMGVDMIRVESDGGLPEVDGFLHAALAG
jgi:hypothetical protein